MLYSAGLNIAEGAKDNIGLNFLIGLFWPAFAIVLLGAYVLEFGASLHKVMTKGFEVSGKQAEPSEVIDPRRVRLEKLLAEREKLTSEIIALRQEFERETPLYRGNALTDLRADETSVQYQPYAPRQGGVNWPFVEELLGRSVDEKWKKGS